MQSKVAIKSCSTYEIKTIQKYLEDSLEYIGGLDKFIKPGEKVLLKVNLTGPFAPEQGATTHPAVVQAVVRILKEFGAIPVIGDGPATIQSPLEITQMSRIAREEDVEAFIFKEYQMVEKENYLIEKDIIISRDVLEADKVISIPKLKTHALTLYTGAIKNSFGTAAYEQRKKLHTHKSIEEFSKVLVDVFTCRVPDLIIIDGIVGMNGIGPVHGNPENYNVLLTSADPVAVDTIGATLLGYNAGNVLMIQEAAALNLGENEIARIKTNCDYHEYIVKTPNIIPHFTGTKRERFISHVMGKVQFNKEKCIKCGECKKGCPGEAITLEPEQQVDVKKCLYCLRCYEVCHRGAITINYKKI